jgi:hypothetical protein
VPASGSRLPLIPENPRNSGVSLTPGPDCPDVLGPPPSLAQPADRQRREPVALPGILPGQLIHADAVMGQVRALGIDLGGARTTALCSLVQELPPTWSPTPSVTAIRSSTNTPPTPASPWPATQEKARSPAEARSEHRSRHQSSDSGIGLQAISLVPACTLRISSDESRRPSPMAVAIYTANVRFAAVFKGFSGSGRGGWLGPGGPERCTFRDGRTPVGPARSKAGPEIRN